ncbi:MAG: Helix-turn-helix domain-containing protein [Candidatus Gottesmanbacteria bacterium GW2011_GWA1_47_8]|uniref:Helix-turn-helix domain-containing protein n=1 Tax=Candidatus Gottesmanbacteria bacterium GW2011_GWA1_47_8 TaxID=1618438 RepID=A0A0G1VSJ6_9BACT|nr:MAG: Helix-turn-helix domain-containing protein [Candidatus Gottesmanbacteria bacterium GW2011_GWA1_47_8]
MKTVGSIFREAREKKHLTLEHVERATKIRKKFLSDIERDDYENLPSAAYAKGFVKNYSDFLGLDAASVLAYFRRQTEEVSKISLLPKKDDATLASRAAANDAGKIFSTPGRCFGCYFYWIPDASVSDDPASADGIVGIAKGKFDFSGAEN